MRRQGNHWANPKEALFLQTRTFDTISVSTANTPNLRCKQYGSSTPTAREGVTSPVILSCRSYLHVGGKLCETGDRSGLRGPQASRHTAIVSLCISHELLDWALTLEGTENASRCPALQRPCRRATWERQKTIEEAPKGVDSHTGARSASGSHSVRKQASTTTGADRRWP